MRGSQRTSVVFFGDFDASIKKALPKLPSQFARLQTDDTEAVAELVDRHVPFLLVFDADKTGKVTSELTKRIGAKHAKARFVALYGKNGPSIKKLSAHRAVTSLLKKPVEALEFQLAVRKAADLLDTESNNLSLEKAVERQRDDLEKFFKIGTALSTERNLEKLLDMIVKECRRATRADAGSLYLMEDVEGEETGPVGAPYRRDEEHPKVLRFTVAQNHSVSVPFQSFTMPVSKSSIAGYVAATGEILNIKDVYHLPSDSPFGYSKAFDESVGYRCCSMLTVPMTNREGEVIGVMQLINKKQPGIEYLDNPENTPNRVEPFDVHDEHLLLSLASQAAVSIEKVRLYNDVEGLFEALAQSYAHALEIRDPVTGGHCARLVHYAMTMAEKINAQTEGPFAGVRFNEDELLELKYASFLHDVGKIGVREAVLNKAHKLSPADEESLRAKFGFIQQSVLTEAYRKGKAKPGEDLPDEVAAEVHAWQEDLEFLLDVNSRGWVKPEEIERIKEIGARQYKDVDRKKRPVLTDHEIENLTIQRGNLSPRERENIESHIALTWDILEEIPWPKRFANVPHIAGSHHEKLDGSGYPHGLKGEQCLVQARLLTILDIFEALTARDRPYKPPMPIEKAIAILQEEADAGHLDKDLVNLFVETEAWKDFQQTFDSLASKAQ
ncbi:MAG: GAF domain-containing protein [Chrysiogenetes bacterium]|nr:GAF domain-containing protein [Chrysiogenetes bacterium]